MAVSFETAIFDLSHYKKCYSLRNDLRSFPFQPTEIPQRTPWVLGIQKILIGKFNFPERKVLPAANKNPVVIVTSPRLSGRLM